MNFLIDNQLPLALAQYLQTRGLDCQHVLDVGLANAADLEICRYAEVQARVIITKDEDFLHLAGRPHAKIKVVWVRLGNCRTAALISAFEKFLPTCNRLWKRATGSSKFNDGTVYPIPKNGIKFPLTDDNQMV